MQNPPESGHMDDLVAIYEAGDEDARMADASNRVEWERTLDLLNRWLPPAPARVLDIGGGPGRYAQWLQGCGYQVTLLDPVPKHVEQARARGVVAVIGDARNLPFDDECAEAVLILGPLYHLPSASDRARALSEAVRCAAPGAVVIAAAMSRWAKPCLRASRSQLGDPGVCAHLLRILEHGQDIEGSTFHQVSYNHDPEEFREEVAKTGLADVLVVGVEGPLGTEARVDPSLADAAISAARIAEARAPHFSLHLLARGIKGAGR
jgi:SAM-dependent methyltransferase